MSWSVILELVSALGLGGIIMYLLQRFLPTKKETTEVKGDILGNGTKVIDIYSQVDDIVKAHTAPLEEKIDELTKKIEDLDKNVCWRRCEVRVRKREEAQSALDISLEDLADYLRSQNKTGNV